VVTVTAFTGPALSPPGPDLVLDVMVYGTPATQGSKVTGMAGNGRRFVREANPDLKRWRSQVAQAAGDAYAGELLDEAVGLDLVFVRPRPSGHFTTTGGLSAAGRRSPYPTGAPDVLKLARAVEDALSGVVWTNDARIVDERIRKAWGERACVRIRVFRLSPPDTS
jgi:Holliday junction resolvase RusA-like endonuclease